MTRPTRAGIGSAALAAAMVCGLTFAGQPALAEGERDEADDADPWMTHRLLAGNWEGTIDGRLGQGKGERRYEFIYQDQFLIGWHASIRLPQEASRKGDDHRELSIYSYDAERGAIMPRQFIIEGHMLEFACETESRRFVCLTERIENGSGMSSRMTIEFEDPYRFTEIFELAGPGEELEVFVTSAWTRAPSLED